MTFLVHFLSFENNNDEVRHVRNTSDVIFFFSLLSILKVKKSTRILITSC